MYFSQNNRFADHMLKQKNLSFISKITHHATPASKIFGGDFENDVSFIRAEGLTATVDALETITWTTADDESGGNSVFGILIKGSAIAEGSNGILEILGMEVEDLNGNATSLAISGPNNSSKASALTTGGNIAIEIAGTGLRLDTEDALLGFRIHYRLK